MLFSLWSSPKRQVDGSAAQQKRKVKSCSGFVGGRAYGASQRNVRIPVFLFCSQVLKSLFKRYSLAAKSGLLAKTDIGISSETFTSCCSSRFAYVMLSFSSGRMFKMLRRLCSISRNWVSSSSSLFFPITGFVCLSDFQIVDFAVVVFVLHNISNILINFDVHLAESD